VLAEPEPGSRAACLVFCWESIAGAGSAFVKINNSNFKLPIFNHTLLRKVVPYPEPPLSGQFGSEPEPGAGAARRTLELEPPKQGNSAKL